VEVSEEFRILRDKELSYSTRTHHLVSLQKWNWYCTWNMKGDTNTYLSLLWKPLWMWQVMLPKNIQDGKIKMFVRKVGCEDVSWMVLAQGCVQWRVLC